MTWDRSIFSSYQTLDQFRSIEIANGSNISVVGIGTVMLRNDSVVPAEWITIKNVLHAPRLAGNLLSVAQLEDRGIGIASCPNGINLVQEGNVIATAKRVGSSYILALSSRADSTRTDSAYAANAKSDTDWQLVHRRFGHAGPHHYKRLHEVTDGLSGPVDIDTKPSVEEPCEPCIVGKKVRVYSRVPEPLKEEVNDLLYVDIWGPYYIPTFKHKIFKEHRYALMLTNSKS